MGRNAKRKHAHGYPVLGMVSFGEIPLREVSGLAVAPLGDGQFVVAVGDRGPDVARAAVLPDGGVGAWDVIDLSQLDAPAGAPKVEQAEAVATDGAHQAMVLIEDPPVLLVLNTADRRLTHAYVLDTGWHEGLDDTWRNDAASRGEGMVLLRDGHVLVVKEKRPAGFVEFGPEGDVAFGISAASLHPTGAAWSPPGTDRLVGLAWWPAPDDLADLSDAAVAPDSGLYLLSDQSNAVARLSLPLLVDGSAAYESVWVLPDEVEKAEGLAFLADGTALVAVDSPAAGRNLATLPPVSTWPRS